MGITCADQESVSCDLLKRHETDVLIVDEAPVEGATLTGHGEDPLFVLEPWVSHNPADETRPWTLLFNPGSWKQILRQPAPPRDRKLGYTLDVPNIPWDPNGGTK